MAIEDTIARLSVRLALDSSEFATGSTDAQRRIAGLRDSVTQLGERWMQTGRRLSIGVTAPLTAFGLLSAKAASDAQELESAFEQTFGDLSPMMGRWARETGDAMGRATQDMQEMANTFGIFFNQAAPTRAVAADMSQTFSELAQDLASFYNVDPGTALQKLRSGLSGESEPLRDFGVFLTEATVKTRALEMGLGDLNGEISEQDKILARYNLILESTTNAQGDVARTSGSTANQARAFGAAMDELQVVIGTKLLPVLTPLIEGATRLVNAFTNLPSGVQTAIIAFGGLLAAIGPIMLVMGSLGALLLPLFAAQLGVVGLAISAFVNPLGTAVVMLGKFALSLGGLTILKTIGVTLLRFAGPIGLIASLGLLIYQNWDRISPMLQEFWTTVQATIGPPLQQLIAVIKDRLTQLWEGPFGEMLRTVISALDGFGQTADDVLGNVLIGLLETALDVAIRVFEGIGHAITALARILDGDFTGAAQSAFAIVDALFMGLPSTVVAMVTQIREWLVGRLNAVWNSVTDGVERVKGAFFGMFDAVVGNSYVPDMVDGIASHMQRLDAVMVRPALSATQAVGEGFRDMARDTQQLLARLFPEVQRLLDYRRDLALIEGSGLSDEQKREARYRLGTEGDAAAGRIDFGLGTGIGQIDPDALDDLVGAVEDSGQDIDTANVRIARSFKDMADQAMSSLNGLVDSIKGGDFLGILEGVLGVGLQIAGLVTGNAGFAGSIPRFANGTNSAPGGLAWVGERGPELVSLPGGSKVTPNHELGGLGGKLQVEVVANNNGFGAIVRNYAGEVVAEAAPSLMQGSSQVTQGAMARRQTRRIS